MKVMPFRAELSNHGPGARKYMEKCLVILYTDVLGHDKQI